MEEIAIISAIALVAFLAIGFVMFSLRDRSQHGGGGAGALTVEILIERIEAETPKPGRHRLRPPLTMKGDLADDLPTQITPLPPEILDLDDHERMVHPLVLHRVLAGIKRS